MVRNQKSIKTGSEVQCFFERKDHNSNVYEDRARIPMFKKIGQNSSVWKDNIRISVCKDKIIIPMLIEIRPEFHCLKG